MRSVNGPYGSFDIGAQYFTVRDPRFQQALDTVPQSLRSWSLNSIQTRNAQGRKTSDPSTQRETHWVGMPDMQALPLAWAAPLWESGRLHLGQSVRAINHHIVGGSSHNSHQWTLMLDTEDHGAQTASGFDTVILALPAPLTLQLLQTAPQGMELAKTLSSVEMAPCWAMTLSYPMAAQAGLTTLGPQWNAARSTHHRVSWLARESSKPGRAQIERWTIQASPAWSREHEQDDAPRASDKLRKAFAEITGIRATPAYAHAQLWHHAQTLTPLGQPFVWDARLQVGLCGDWCLGNRVEHAFVSGLDLALAALAR